MSEDFLKELSNWQKITISKDLLAVFAWLFVALGTRDNMLLMHLESMEKYASDADSPTWLLTNALETDEYKVTKFFRVNNF